MEQTKALNALEPFLALCKSASSPRAAADLVTRATSNPNTFLFTELLQRPQIQALSRSDEFKSHLTLLQIFSYGIYADYQQATSLPPLNDAQTLKLRQLSLLTLARDRANLTYSALQKALGLSDRRALEDLIISAIYAGLLDATLDPYRGAVQVNSLAPLRDLAPGSIPPMIKSLNAWSDRCTSTLRELEEQMASIRNEAARRHTYRESREQKLAKALEELKDQELGGQRKLAVGHAANLLAKNQRYNKRGSGSMMDGPEDIDDEAMDVDDEDDDVGEKKRASRRKL